MERVSVGVTIASRGYAELVTQVVADCAHYSRVKAKEVRGASLSMARHVADRLDDSIKTCYCIEVTIDGLFVLQADEFEEDCFLGSTVNSTAASAATTLFVNVGVVGLNMSSQLLC